MLVFMSLLAFLILTSQLCLHISIYSSGVQIQIFCFCFCFCFSFWLCFCYDEIQNTCISSFNCHQSHKLQAFPHAYLFISTFLFYQTPDNIAAAPICVFFGKMNLFLRWICTKLDQFSKVKKLNIGIKHSFPAKIVYHSKYAKGKGKIWVFFALWARYFLDIFWNDN